MLKKSLAMVAALIALSTCGRIDLIGFTLGVPLVDDPVWGSHQMVIDLGAEGTLDTSRLNDMAVICDGGLFKIWYSASDGANYRIIYAESQNGTDWTDFQEAVSPGNLPPYDTTGPLYPEVIKIGSYYKMWYSATGDDNRTRIIYCDSWDGLNWSNFQVAVDPGAEGDYDSDGAYSPTVVLNEGKYRMWYTGLDTGMTAGRTIYCDSPDGISWSNHQMVVDIRKLPGYDDLSNDSATVIVDGGLFKMWYTGQYLEGSDFKTYIIYCDSIDGLSWDNYSLVMGAGKEGTHDAALITGPEVINLQGTGLMWYRGKGTDGKMRILYCTTGP